MGERLREHYFLVVRIGVLLILEVYIVLSQSILTGTSGRVFLLLALFIGAMAGKELVEKEKKWLFFVLAAVLWGGIITTLGYEFMLLGIVLCYECISFQKPGFLWYWAPVAMAWMPSKIGMDTQVLISLFLGMLYVQHDFVVESYRQQTKEETMLEQH